MKPIGKYYIPKVLHIVLLIFIKKILFKMTKTLGIYQIFNNCRHKKNHFYVLFEIKFHLIAINVFAPVP